MDIADQILKLEENFQVKNQRVIAFFNNKIETETIPGVLELFQYSLVQYLESIEAADCRFESLKSFDEKLRLLTDRDLYLNYVFAAYGIPTVDEDDKKKVK